VLPANSLRPLGLFAASRSFSDVRMPADFRLSITSEPSPSRSFNDFDKTEIPKDPEGRSGELRKTRNRADEFVGRIRTELLTRETEQRAGDALHLAHAQTQSHQLGTDAHDAAEHTTRRCIRRSFGCARRSIEQRLDLVRRSFLDEECENDTDSF